MTHETKTDGTTVPSTERHNYVTALIFWLIIWIPYINGVAAGTDINYIGFTSAILNLVAIWYIIYYIFKSVTAGNKEDASTEANSAGTGLNTPVGRAANHVVDFAKDKLEAFRKRHITRISQILNHTLASLARVAEEVEKTDWAYLVANQRKIKHDFEQLTDDLVTLLHERAVDSLIPQRILKDLLHDTFVVQKQANGFADTPFNSTDAAEQKQLIAEMKKWFGRSGAGLQLYPRWQNELKL